MLLAPINKNPTTILLIFTHCSNKLVIVLGVQIKDIINTRAVVYITADIGESGAWIKAYGCAYIVLNKSWNYIIPDRNI